MLPYAYLPWASSYVPTGSWGDLTSLSGKYHRTVVVDSCNLCSVLSFSPNIPMFRLLAHATTLTYSRNCMCDVCYRFLAQGF